MKLGKTVTAAGIVFAALGLAAAAMEGCSSSTPAGPGTTTGGGTQPPAKPSGPATTSTAEHNFALHTLFLGDTDRAGTVSSSAWKDYGYNLDGKTSTKDSTDVCTLASGASKSFQADGNGGIDNSFGLNILPIIVTVAGSDATTKINTSINNGTFTVMMDTVGLTDDPAQTATSLTGKLFAAGKFGQAPNADTATPTWTTADNWPVAPEFVTGGDITKPKIVFTDSYIVNGQYVNGSPTDVTLSLGIAGVTLTVTIHHAVIVFNHTGAKATNGTIAGVITTEELVAGLKGVAGNISTSLCSGSAFDQIAGQIRQASDIFSDGTNAAGKPCDAISIGIGFTADEIGVPKAVGVTKPGTDPCAASTDAGTGADTGSGTGDDASTGDSSTPADAAAE